MTAAISQTTAVDTSPSALPRTLTLIETLGFGLTGLLLWISVAPGAHAELGIQAMWVWIPGALLGVIVNFQVRQLGQRFPDVAGGTPNYLTHLLPDLPWLTRYAALGYFLSWVAVLPVNAIILTELIQTNLRPLGITLPAMGLKVGFVLLAFVVAFSGSRALSTLHLVFLVPAVGLLLLFCLQGSAWLFAANYSHNWPHDWTAVASTNVDFSLQSWAKWYLNGTYAFYACETASAFVADSKQPQKTLQSLLVVAGLIPVVYVVGSWLLLHLPNNAVDPQNTFLTLLVAARPYWGSATPLLVTFLIVSSCLLSFATAVSLAPRVLYQLAKDQQLTPLFASVSEEGVFASGLGLTLLLSLGGLAWGDLHQIVMVTGVGWLIAFIVLHGGLWYQRGQIGGFMPWLALLMAALEVFVLGLGGWAWRIQNLAIGLLLPLVVILGDRLFYRCSALILPWLNRPKRAYRQTTFETLIVAQVALLIGFTILVSTISWRVSAAIANTKVVPPVDFLVVLILVMSFLGVAIACWTVFPQIAAINNARQTAEALSEELNSALSQVQQTQLQMVQQEKLSSIGQLVAGIAHEINNPVNFIHGNLTYTQTYVKDLLGLVQLYQSSYPRPTDKITTEIEAIDLAFLSEDLPKMLNSMTLGTERIRGIVLSLRNFSRKDEAACKSVDIHEGLESTMLILQHRLKAVTERPAVEILRDYGELPLVECYPSQLNQVFMNILANALDAMEETNVGRSYEEIETRPNQITLRTRLVSEQWIEIAIADNGSGIPEAIRSRIFDPFFTTKPAGKGTGLGMSISYQIITQHHQGKLSCACLPNQGTEFTIQIPRKQQATKPTHSSTHSSGEASVRHSVEP
ncbi:MAG: PAS domain-containing sensor histidine kinase [Phormidesmis priestleyi]|uniref:histidine kinase n=1 Tax=Phormidesmis priestleyi TaxID=268141 RepID=A0A2W4XGS6_9CYAN|nr:MAG: PAS domain-containing sensor histidine kinase [Phormidesmis priestleyi]